MSKRSVGFILLVVATLIFAAANSVIAKLGEIGAHNLIDGRNPISFCNVLFTANLIAGLTLLAIHHRDWKKETLAAISGKDWTMMVILAILSGVIGPTLFFLGLMLTPVINVVLIATLDIPLALLLGYLMLKERPNWGTVVGASLAVVGIAVTFLLHQPPQMPMEMRMTMINIGDGPVARLLATTPKAGEICIALATLFIVFSVELSRKTLANVPVGIFSVFRMIVGAIIFFVVVLIMLGPVHFIDIFSPFLWEWMALYGGVIIAGGLYLWYRGIQSTESADLSIANSITPVAGIFFAYLILGEIPEYGQYVGGALIVLGILIALAVKLRREQRAKVLFSKPKAFTGV